MRITKRQLRSVIREGLIRETGRSTFPRTGPTALESKLEAVWNEVSADTLQALGGTATVADIADEVLAVAPFDVVDEFNLLPFPAQQALLQKIFGGGRSY